MKRVKTKNFNRLAVVSIISSAFFVPALAYAADPLENLPFAISGGAPNVDVRFRYETVAQDLPTSITSDASAFTVRSRLGYTTGKWNNIDGQLEFENLTAIGNDSYNSTLNTGTAQYPVVADPEGSELNQAWLRYSEPTSKTALKVGRQRIIFDNARFIGNVGWRQREQTYDAVLLSNTYVPKLTIDYAHLASVNAFRYNKVGSTLSTTRDIKGELIHANYAYSKALNLSAYGYLLDFEAPLAPENSPSADTQTIGLRVNGTTPIHTDYALSYAAEYANQSQYGDSTSVVDSNYYLAELGAAYKQLINLKVGYEVLGSHDGKYGFQTPLATLHAFQGWADLFLTTPANGLKETYVSASGTAAKFPWMVRWSDFSADKGGASYGTEIDAQITRSISEQLGVGVKYAAYSGKSDAPITGVSPIKANVDKFWIWTEYKF